MQTPITTNTPRRLVLLLGAGLILSLWMVPSSLAQGFGFNPERMKERLAAQVEDTIEQLALTDEQEEPVRAILEENTNKRIELITNARESGSREAMMAMREDTAALNEETEKKLAEVLTEEQLTKYQEIQAERASRRRGRRGGM
ncbi:MAG: hypothetical protein ACE5G0_06040 [Rhodothermales bacterium]